MFKAIGGSVKLSCNGIYMVKELAVFAKEPVLYALIGHQRATILHADGKTSHGWGWGAMELPKLWATVPSSARGYVQVEPLAVKTRKRLTGK